MIAFIASGRTRREADAKPADEKSVVATLGSGAWQGGSGMPGKHGKDRKDARQEQALAEELRIRLDQQAVIAELGLTALSGTDLQDLMDRAVRQVADTLAVEYCKVLELMPGGEELLLTAGVGWRSGLVGKATVGSDLNSQAGFTLKTKEPVIVQDFALETRFRGPPLLVEHGVKSGLSVMIHGPGRVFGVLGAHTRSLRHFSRHDVYFIQAVANIVGEAVERKRGEQALKRAHDELEQRVAERTRKLSEVIKELESFSYAVSHDLRAPLRSIDGFARALQEDYGETLDEAGRSYLERIVRGGQRMGSLIDGLLDLSRINHVPISFEPVNLSEIAERISNELRERNPRRDVDVEIAESLTVIGDRRLLGIVLTNLLDNAWKYSRERNPARIELGAISENGETAYYVRDNGIGFDMKYAAKLFVPFQRLHAGEVEGSGVGLATVKRIIHRHNGRLWAEGKPGEGSTFYFTIGDTLGTKDQ
jgi:signal transduction histidine kinase